MVPASPSTIEMPGHITLKKINLMVSLNAPVQSGFCYQTSTMEQKLCQQTEEDTTHQNTHTNLLRHQKGGQVQLTVKK